MDCGEAAVVGGDMGLRWGELCSQGAARPLSVHAMFILLPVGAAATEGQSKRETLFGGMSGRYANVRKATTNRASSVPRISGSCQVVTPPALRVALRSEGGEPIGAHVSM